MALAGLQLHRVAVQLRPLPLPGTLGNTVSATLVSGYQGIGIWSGLVLQHPLTYPFVLLTMMESMSFLTSWR